MLLILFALQAAAAPPPERIDLLSLTQQPCPAEGGSDVVVCARPQDAPRLPPVATPPERAPADALTRTLPGGGSVNLHAIQTYLPGGTGQGAAVTLRLPLGRRARR